MKDPSRTLHKSNQSAMTADTVNAARTTTLRRQAASGSRAANDANAGVAWPMP